MAWLIPGLEMLLVIDPALHDQGPNSNFIVPMKSVMVLD